ncbi:MAG: tyrosine-type recombinase/integrase, partial [Candidatus Saccharibacteria bacterium]|nr:tyrosine-type recombinase/integrase [Candidatus Saccharibacteria bacterium]
MNDLNKPTPPPFSFGEVSKKDYLSSITYAQLIGDDLALKERLKKAKQSKFSSSKISKQISSTLVFQIYDEENFADYNLGVRKFVDFICPDKRVAFIHRDSLSDFKTHLGSKATDKNGKKLKPATQRKYFLIAKNFVLALHKNKALSEDITTHLNGRPIKAPKAPTNSKKPFSQTELRKILDLYRELNDPKLKLLICLLYFHALRIGEVALLDFNSFDLSGKTITIRGKGGYIDSQEMHSQLIQCFREYSRVYKNKTALFTTKDKPTSKRTLQQMVNKFLNHLGIFNKSA